VNKNETYLSNVAKEVPLVKYNVAKILKKT